MLSIWLIRYLLGKSGNMHPFIQSILFSVPDYALRVARDGRRSTRQSGSECSVAAPTTTGGPLWKRGSKTSMRWLRAVFDDSISFGSCYSREGGDDDDREIMRCEKNSDIYLEIDMRHLSCTIIDQIIHHIGGAREFGAGAKQMCSVITADEIQ